MRPRKGQQPRKHRSIRLEDRHFDAIIKRYGSLQAWIDAMILISLQSSSL